MSITKEKREGRCEDNQVAGVRMMVTGISVLYGEFDKRFRSRVAEGSFLPWA